MNQDALFPLVEVQPALSGEHVWIGVHRREGHHVIFEGSAGPVHRDRAEAVITGYLAGEEAARRLEHRAPACHSPWFSHEDCADLPKVCMQPWVEARGFVYFIQTSGGPVKIGRSIRPEVRLAEIQLMSPVPLHLAAAIPGGADKETELHRRFAYCRLHGEWFDPVPELMDLILEIRGEVCS